MLLISVYLIGCANNAVTTKTVYRYPPQAYLHACPKTPFIGTTYGEAVEYVITVMAQRDICAAQIDAINRWIKQTKGDQK